MTNSEGRYIIDKSFGTIVLIAVGVDSEEGPPVSIPNTVVKLFSAENTWRAAAREDKATPTSSDSRFHNGCFAFTDPVSRRDLFF